MRKYLLIFGLCLAMLDTHAEPVVLHSLYDDLPSVTGQEDFAEAGMPVFADYQLSNIAVEACAPAFECPDVCTNIVLPPLAITGYESAVTLHCNSPPALYSWQQKNGRINYSTRLTKRRC